MRSKAANKDIEYKSKNQVFDEGMIYPRHIQQENDTMEVSHETEPIFDNEDQRNDIKVELNYHNRNSIDFRHASSENNGGALKQGN